MAEPTIRPIREADVKQIHEIEKACFAMPWSEASILHDVKENVVARWLVLDDGNGGVLATRACGLCSTRRTSATWPFARTAGERATASGFSRR